LTGDERGVVVGDGRTPPAMSSGCFPSRPYREVVPA